MKASGLLIPLFAGHYHQQQTSYANLLPRIMDTRSIFPGHSSLNPYDRPFRRLFPAASKF